jgi:tRNA(Arg) A34 adenosine deaminase TadA
MVIKDKDIEWYRTAARAKAADSDMRKPMSALLLRKNEVICEANNYRVWGFQEKFSIHAEEALISLCAKKGIKTSGCTVFVYRKRAKNINGTSRPCIKCMEILKKAGIKQIIYFNGDNFMVEGIKK